MDSERRDILRIGSTAIAGGLAGCSPFTDGDDEAPDDEDAVAQETTESAETDRTMAERTGGTVEICRNPNSESLQRNDLNLV